MTCTGVQSRSVDGDARDALADSAENFIRDRFRPAGVIIGGDALARLLADANVNVDLAYTTSGGLKIVIATDDVQSARGALQ